MENITEQTEQQVKPMTIRIKKKQPVLSPIVTTQNNEELPSQQRNQSLTELYIDSLSEKELMAYYIAKNHLESTFSLEKSNGFIEWKKTNILFKFR